MDRRKFLGVAASALVTTPLAARAQQMNVIHHIGWLSMAEPPTPAVIQEAWTPARKLGWIEGQNLIVERRYTSGRPELLRPFAEELVRLKVEIIATSGTDATLAAKSATTSIPIVFDTAGDAVGAGLVASLARPGGNVTGISFLAQEVDAKRLSLLRELLPRARRVGDLENPNNPIWRMTRGEYEQAYRSLGLEPIFIQVATAGELESAVADVARRGGHALIVRSDALFMRDHVGTMQAALRYKLPTFVDDQDFLAAGALLSYSAGGSDDRFRFLVMIDKILRGAKPADIPVEQPTKFELGVNLKTAKALGITIPQSLLLRADEVIR